MSPCTNSSSMAELTVALLASVTERSHAGAGKAEPASGAAPPSLPADDVPGSIAPAPATPRPSLGVSAVPGDGAAGLLVELEPGGAGLLLAVALGVGAAAGDES